MLNWMYYTGANHCPVCGSGKNKCRIDPARVKIHCGGDVPNLNYIYRGEDAKGYKIFVSRDRQNQFLSADKAAWLRQEEMELAIREAEAVAYYSKQISVEQRDLSIRALMQQLSLCDSHKSKLLARGLSEQTIARLGFVSLQNDKLSTPLQPGLPGISPEGDRVVGAPGILCPTISVDGKYTGYQIMTNNITYGKYLWGSTKNGVTKEIIFCSNLTNGELPITVIRGVKVERIGLCEGILKPAIACELHGYTFIGASGGNFNASQTQLKEALAILKAENPAAIITFYPDANAVSNKDVFKRDKRTLELLVSWGYAVEIADWQQLYSKTAKDVDEITQNQNINYLDYQTYTQLDPTVNSLKATWVNALGKVKRYLKKPLKATNVHQHTTKYVPGLLPQYEPGLTLPTYLFEPGQTRSFYTEAVKKGWTYVWDASGTGTGKTHAVGEMYGHQFFDKPLDGVTYRLFYLSKNARNPSVEAIERYFVEAAVKNDGFVLDTSKKTPLGNPYRFHPQQNEIPRTVGNCHLTHLHRVLSDKRQDSEVICKSCPFFKQCKSSEGKGFGYKYQASKTLASSRIRANIKGLTHEMIDKKSILIVDEFSQSLEPVDVVKVKPAEIKNTLLKIKYLDRPLYQQLEPLEEALIRAFDSYDKTKYPFGMSYQALKPLLPSTEGLASTIASVINLEMLEERVKECITKISTIKREDVEQLVDKNWLALLLQVITDQTKGSLQLNPKELTIAVKNERQIKVLQAAKAVIFQDATGSPFELGLTLGVDGTDIIRGKVVSPEVTNLTITQINGFGLAKKDRAPQTDERLDKLVQMLMQKHGGEENIGFIDWKSKAKPGWLTHFGDARGSNSYERKQAVASIGAPHSNLGAVQLVYEALTGETISLDKGNTNEVFERYYEEKTIAEVLQEIGRLRANRRTNEALTYYLIADLDLTFLSELGFNVVSHESSAYGDELADKQVLGRKQILEAFRELVDEQNDAGTITATAVALKAGKAVSQISRVAKAFGGWSNLKKILLALIYKTAEQVTPPDNPTEEELHTAWLAESYLPLLYSDAVSDEESISELANNQSIFGLNTICNALCRLSRQNSIRFLRKLLQIDLIVDWGTLNAFLSLLPYDFAQTLFSVIT